jgi:hypothetical protein
MGIVLPFLTAILLVLSSKARSEELECSLSAHELQNLDPNLKEMTYDVGDGPQNTLVYVEPPVTSFYKDGKAPASQIVMPKHNGLAGKFINMSNKRLSLYWEESEGGAKHEMRHHLPFTSSGTATFPGHRFLFTEEKNPEKVLKRMIVTEYPESIYYYDPYHVDGDPGQTEKNLEVLNDDERAKYDGWRKTLIFDEQVRRS